MTSETNEQANPVEVENEPPADNAAAVLEAELTKAREERDAAIDRLARVQAEFDNARRRAQREQKEYREFALAEAIRLLLPILDSFDRALASNAAGAEFRSGMELIDRQLHDVLTKLGVTAVPAQGEPFDPNLHEAIEMVETEAAPDQYVLDELQRGYKLKGRLLRPAMVRVARNSKPPASA
jgi:molecular chaperone GrpE